MLELPAGATKSMVAFLMTCERFFAHKKRAFFWTFTFRKTMPDWWYPRSWNVFIKTIQNHYGGFLQGVRVLEVHPSGHGLHYHAIIDQRISFHVVNKHWRRVGGGRTSVETADAGTAMYLAKYLTKQNPLSPGMRRWGTIGAWRQTRKNDLVVQSEFHRNMKKFAPLGGKIPFLEARAIFGYSRLYGAVEEWPVMARKSVVKKLDKGRGLGSIGVAVDCVAGEK